jgi:hypothetical protein
MKLDAPNDHDQPPPPQYARARLSPMRRASKLASGVVGAWFLMFLATFVVAGEAYGGSRPGWGFALIGAVAVACAVVAWRTRATKPEVSAGIWTGLGVGLLQAGLCFAGT